MTQQLDTTTPATLLRPFADHVHVTFNPTGRNPLHVGSDEWWRFLTPMLGPSSMLLWRTMAGSPIPYQGMVVEPGDLGLTGATLERTFQRLHRFHIVDIETAWINHQQRWQDYAMWPIRWRVPEPRAIDRMPARIRTEILEFIERQPS